MRALTHDEYDVLARTASSVPFVLDAFNLEAARLHEQGIRKEHTP